MNDFFGVKTFDLGVDREIRVAAVGADLNRLREGVAFFAVRASVEVVLNGR